MTSVFFVSLWLTAVIALIPTTVIDPHSYARSDQARVTHVALDLGADFTRKVLEGTATLTLQVAADARELVLDTRGLEIQGVADRSGTALVPACPGPCRSNPWQRADDRPARRSLDGGGALPHVDRRGAAVARAGANGGRRASLSLLAGRGNSHAHLDPRRRTAQASPQTYRARIVVPAPLRVVMSADALTLDGTLVAGGRAFEFALEQPVPPYLFAIAVGDIVFQPVGPRSGVYAEPTVVDRAAFEFADVEKMIAAAEKLYGPYRWGQYDVLVLPPSFPFGGMENPRLTFATPTILAGTDRSLVSLVAHELAHSWSGNLVTNATWSDFWLNEGFTVYFERRIMEEVYGREYSEMLALLGYQDLEATVAELPARDTHLSSISPAAIPMKRPRSWRTRRATSCCA